MSENTEATAAAPAKKRGRPAGKKAEAAAPAKKRGRPPGKKAEAAAPAKKRGRPAGKKAEAAAPAKKRGRPAGKKSAKQFAYLLLTTQEDGSQKASAMNGPFATESNALDDASIMSDDNTTIVLFREVKRGRVQKQTKFVAG